MRTLISGVLLFSLFSAVVSAGGFLRIGDRITTEGLSITLMEPYDSTSIRLAICDEATTRILDFVYEKKPYTGDNIHIPYKSWDAINTQIRSITFRDRESVWIISRLGHRLGGAVLLDLKTDTFTIQYHGNQFSLSPDRRNIAYSYPYGRNMLSTIFVNGIMVSPFEYERNLIGREPSELQDKDIDWETFYARLRSSDNSWKLRGAIEWINSSTFKYTLQRPVKDGEMRMDTVTLPKDEATSGSIKINRKMLNEDLVTRAVDSKYIEASTQVPPHPWHIERVENIKAETIEECIWNVANIDDLHFAMTSSSLMPSLECPRFVAVMVTHLLRVRRILEESQTERAHIVRLLRVVLDESVGSYIDVYKEREKQWSDYSQGKREKNPDYIISQVRASVAMYCLTELGDLESLPLMAKAFKMHEYGRAPIVPPGFCFYAMHRLILTCPESKLSTQQKELRNLYLEKAQSHFLEPVSYQGTPWNASYSEDDPRRIMQDPAGNILIHVPNKTGLVVYEPLFSDGTDISDLNLIVDPRAYELFASMEPFIATIQK